MTAPIDGVTLDDYIRARARLENAPGDVGAVVAQLSLPDVDAWRRIERAWRDRTEQNARLAAVVGEFIADYVEELREELERDDGPDLAEADLVRHEVPSYLKESASPAAGPLVPVPPAPAAPAVDLDVTQPPLRRLANTTLPFMRGVDMPDAVRAAWAAVHQAEVMRRDPEEARRSEDGVDETAFVPRSLFTETPRATPFEGAAPASKAAPPMPMEEYAAFLAELAQDRGREGFLRAKYGIEGERAQHALGAAFAALFQGDPAQRERFDALLAAKRGSPSNHGAPPAASMTVETYATISAAMAGGDHPEVVLARLGLRADDWAAAMQQMSERFAAEPHLRLAYQEHVRRARGRGSS